MTDVPAGDGSGVQVFCDQCDVTQADGCGVQNAEEIPEAVIVVTEAFEGIAVGRWSRLITDALSA